MSAEADLKKRLEGLGCVVLPKSAFKEAADRAMSPKQKREGVKRIKSLLAWEERSAKMGDDIAYDNLGLHAPK